jgi:hypothetical protein
MGTGVKGRSMRHWAATAVNAAAATTDRMEAIHERGSAFWVITAEVIFNSS